VTEMSLVVMTSATRIWSGWAEEAVEEAMMSRSVMMPTTVSDSSTTISEPARWSRIRWAAWAMLSCGLIFST